MRSLSLRAAAHGVFVVVVGIDNYVGVRRPLGEGPVEVIWVASHGVVQIAMSRNRRAVFVTRRRRGRDEFEWRIQAMEVAVVGGLVGLHRDGSTITPRNRRPPRGIGYGSAECSVASSSAEKQGICTLECLSSAAAGGREPVLSWQREEGEAGQGCWLAARRSCFTQ